MKVQKYDHIKDIKSIDTSNCNFLTQCDDVIHVTPQKDYLNELVRHVSEGWVIFLNNDSTFIDNSFIEQLAKECAKAKRNDVLIYQTFIGPKKLIIPKRNLFEKQQILRGNIHISSFCAHFSLFESLSFDARNNCDFHFFEKIRKDSKFNFKFVSLPIGIWVKPDKALHNHDMVSKHMRSLVNNSYTDKNTTHSYLQLYETLLEPIKDTAENILEVGIGDFGTKNGGSLLLWTNYFTKATIHGIDILPSDRVLDKVINDPSIKLYCNSNAYDMNFISKNFSNTKFDFLLDDGPHSLKSQEKFIELYSPLLSENGILIVEDVQNISWIEQLKNKTPQHLKQYIKTYDLRKNKGRYDDIVFTIDKVSR
jgi:cephalosporin hydroxylase